MGVLQRRGRGAKQRHGVFLQYMAYILGKKEEDGREGRGGGEKEKEEEAYLQNDYSLAFVLVKVWGSI